MKSEKVIKYKLTLENGDIVKLRKRGSSFKNKWRGIINVRLWFFIDDRLRLWIKRIK